MATWSIDYTRLAITTRANNRDGTRAVFGTGIPAPPYFCASVHEADTLLRHALADSRDNLEDHIAALLSLFSFFQEARRTGISCAEVAPLLLGVHQL